VRRRGGAARRIRTRRPHRFPFYSTAAEPRPRASERRERGKEIVPHRTRPPSSSPAGARLQRQEAAAGQARRRGCPRPPEQEETERRRRMPEAGGPSRAGLRRRHLRPLPLRPRPRARAGQEAVSAFSSRRSLPAPGSRFVSPSRRQISYTIRRLDLNTQRLFQVPQHVPARRVLQRRHRLPLQGQDRHDAGGALRVPAALQVSLLCSCTPTPCFRQLLSYSTYFFLNGCQE
jgi:hypothetical protein